MRSAESLLMFTAVLLSPMALGQPVAEAPVRVMSDTAEYCTQLEQRIGALPARSAEVRRLVSTGHRLCDHGQVRRGVSYMRRALIMQRGDAPQ